MRRTDDHDAKESQRILAELENIDDECDGKGIAFVKIDDDNVAREYGVDHVPTLVYFENKIPSLYHGDLANEEQVLAWLVDQLASDMIEDITDEMLDKLIKKTSHLAVLFCKLRKYVTSFSLSTLFSSSWMFVDSNSLRHINSRAVGPSVSVDWLASRMSITR